METREKYKAFKYSMTIFKRPELENIYFSDDLKALKSLIITYFLKYDEYFLCTNEVKNGN